MTIDIKKTTRYQCDYTVTRNDGSVDRISLDTKTYLVHDICHYAVEKNLAYSKGFWGMLSEGYAFNELLGKDNALTAELRFIEKVVGPVQSVYLGYVPQQKFGSLTEHLDFNMPESMLNACLADIERVLNAWRQLAVGQQLRLEWVL